MALDGRRNFARTHNWPTSKSRKIEYGAKQEEIVEEDMVVLLYAGSPRRIGHAETNTGEG
jgi:hypothetical protein